MAAARSTGRAELVRISAPSSATGSATPHRTPQPRTALRNPSAPSRKPFAIPAAIAVTTVAGGAVLRIAGLWWVAILLAVAGWVAVDFAVRNSPLRNELVIWAAFAAASAAGSALGFAGVGLLTAVAAAAGTVRLATHPALRTRRDDLRRAAEREAFLSARKAAWPAVAEAQGMPHVDCYAIRDDRGVGHTYRLRVPHGYTLNLDSQQLNNLTSRLERRAGEVTFTADPDGYLWLGELHVQEMDPRKAFDLLAQQPAESICEPGKVGPYRDSEPYGLVMYDQEVGATNLLVAGASRIGKSELMLRLMELYQQAPDLAWLVADGAQGRDFRFFSGSVFRYIDQPADFLRLLETFWHLLLRRERLMADRDWQVWEPSADEPVYVLLIEEGPRFASSNQGEELGEWLQKMALRTGAAGIKIILIAQVTNGPGVWSWRFRRMLQDRIQFAMGEGAAESVLNGGGVELLTMDDKGQFVAETPGHRRGIPVVSRRVEKDNRPVIAEAMAECNARPDAEWAEAEKALDQQKAAIAHPTPTMVSDTTVEGEIAQVRDLPTVRPGIILPVVVPDAPKGPVLSGSRAEEVCREAMRKAAPSGGMARQALEEMTGWGRSKVMKDLVHPWMRAGLAESVGQGRDTRYVWTAALPSA